MDEILKKLRLDVAEEIEDCLRIGFGREEKRLKHVFEVARRVRSSAAILKESLPELDVDEAYRGALLHDIGYLEPLKVVDFHPIDGANFLRSKNEARLASLIECHSNSPEQAQLRGLGGIEISRDPIAELITFWDVQVLQGGKLVSYQERLVDIEARYGPDSLVFRSHQLAQGRIEAILQKYKQLIDAQLASS